MRMKTWQLDQRVGLPLELKIKKSIMTIERFFEKHQGDVYVSRGGVDSLVVSLLVKETIFGDMIKIENVSVASVEQPSIIKYNLEDGVTLIKSGGTMKVIQEWGYPVISKDVAMKISRHNRTKHEWVRKRRMEGYVGKNGKVILNGKIPNKYKFLIYAPFELSEKCCDKTKKKPLKEFEKKSGKKPITGERVFESRNRKENYMKNGCITSSKKREKCTPIAFWTDEDIKNFLALRKVNLPEAYGKIIEIEGKKEFSKEKRTGCTICGFGILYDDSRFERLREESPFQYNYMFGGGKWERRETYRFVKFRPNSIPIWSNLYWIPSQQGYGYKRVLNYIYEGLNINKRWEIIK